MLLMAKIQTDLVPSTKRKRRKQEMKSQMEDVRNNADITKLAKWKKAVIHLECATDSEHFYDRIKKIDEMREKLDRGKISLQEFEKFEDELIGKSRDIRQQGTAVFIIHKQRRYLLTARHVVYDERSAKRELQEEIQRVSSWPENVQKSLVQSAIERAKNRIFNIIFRVPSLDEIIKYGPEAHSEFLMNLGAGTSFNAPYTFSSPELDLALISLDQRDSKFADQLLELGYEPIPSDFIGDGPSCEGSEVFTVGYPAPTALLGQVNLHPALRHWSSSYFSLPVSSFGRVSMMHDELPFYWVDMSVYPGNSGGPIIENDKIVGIASTQAILPTDFNPNIETRIPFGRIIKTKYVHELLQIQEQKDNL